MRTPSQEIRVIPKQGLHHNKNSGGDKASRQSLLRLLHVASSASSQRIKSEQLLTKGTGDNARQRFSILKFINKSFAGLPITVLPLIFD
jgi:hypothetical protein